MFSIHSEIKATLSL